MRDGLSIRIAREGDDVRNADDYRLLFNSRWPVSPVVASGLIPSNTSCSTTEDIPIYEHNLGYRPLFLLWQDKGISVSDHTTGAVSFFNNDAIELGSVIVMDENKLYLKKNTGGVITSTYSYYYVILQVNIDELFEAEKIRSNDDRKVYDTVRKKRSIFRVLNDRPFGKDDTRKYSVHEHYQPLMVHSITPFIKPDNVFENVSVEHNLGYPPAFLVYGKIYGSEGGYRKIEFAPESSVGAFASVNKTHFNMGITLPFEGSIVLLKDPIL